MKTGDTTHEKTTEMNTDLPSADYASITKSQRETWSSGDLTRSLARTWSWPRHSVKPLIYTPASGSWTWRGSGTAALVAERRYCDVTGLDYASGLIERAKTRAQANGQDIDFHVGDAQDMPFPDNSFDVVLSVYGVQFASDQKQAARELLRVCRPGGKIDLAGLIPDGWSGDWFAVHAQ